MKNIYGLIYRDLFAHYGEQDWWPGQTRFEVITGAILTQNTAWTNVEKAIRNLKKAKLLSPEKMHQVKIERLSKLIRSAGYFNVKARRLKNFTELLFSNYEGSLSRLFKLDTETLRAELLSVNGIGPETADSILLYAANRPAFVVDAYTKRILLRHKLCKENATYDEIQKNFTKNLRPDKKIFNEYHALIVRVGKELCRPKKPLCTECPLKRHF
jgi:endonuclease-3 related protein